jgi:hypothetical protein
MAALKGKRRDVLSITNGTFGLADHLADVGVPDGRPERVRNVGLALSFLVNRSLWLAGGVIDGGKAAFASHFR